MTFWNYVTIQADESVYDDAATAFSESMDGYGNSRQTERTETGRLLVRIGDHYLVDEDVPIDRRARADEKGPEVVDLVATVLDELGSDFAWAVHNYGNDTTDSVSTRVYRVDDAVRCIDRFEGAEGLMGADTQRHLQRYHGVSPPLGPYLPAERDEEELDERTDEAPAETL